jgi:hypothetical protein
MEAIFPRQERCSENATAHDTEATKGAGAMPGIKCLPASDADLGFQQSLATPKDFPVPAGLTREPQ